VRHLVNLDGQDLPVGLDHPTYAIPHGLNRGPYSIGGFALDTSDK